LYLLAQPCTILTYCGVALFTTGSAQTFGSGKVLCGQFKLGYTALCSGLQEQEQCLKLIKSVKWVVFLLTGEQL
jgi:hypothetical protein